MLAASISAYSTKKASFCLRWSRIECFGAGRAVTAADFSDVAGRRNAAKALGRLHAKGEIARAIRGVYYVTECSALMGTEVPAGADEVVRAVARANKWIVAPSGAAALNALGLDTQVPAKLVYVSSGPYKRYEYGPYDIELRHRANRDLLDCSQITCTIVQALKALGRENVGDEVIRTLARNLTEEQVGASWKSRWGSPPGLPTPRRRYGGQSMDRIVRASTDERGLVEVLPHAVGQADQGRPDSGCLPESKRRSERRDGFPVESGAFPFNGRR